MNLDRALAILGVIVGVLGAAAGVYVSKQDHSLGLLLASGWVAAALIGITICTLAFRAITAMEKSHKEVIQTLDGARKEAENRADVLRLDLTALQAEVAEFRNISRALSAVVNGEDKPKVPRTKGRRQGRSMPDQDIPVQQENIAPAEIKREE